MNIIERRSFERFSVPPMYTAVVVRTLAGPDAPLEGHAYNVSEAGIRFELDRPLDAGTLVRIRVELPAGSALDSRISPVEAVGQVIWTDNDPDEPGPVRMAVAFQAFASGADRDRLLDYLSAHEVRRAA